MNAGYLLKSGLLRFAFPCLVLAAFPAAKHAQAQVLYGSIVGNLKDSTGAVAPRAVVSIAHVETNRARQTSANEADAYVRDDSNGNLYPESNALLVGWQLNWLFSSYTGLPFGVGASGSSLNAPKNSQRAHQVKPNVEKLGAIGAGTPFYDPTAFAPVLDAPFGTAGFNALRVPGLVNLDFGLFHDFIRIRRLYVCS
jgi:hypothetical protein